MIKQSLISILITLSFTGCIVGDVVALPFRVTGAIVNTVAPDIVGDSISTTGDVIDGVIPF
jgi:hypothetical protein